MHEAKDRPENEQASQARQVVAEIKLGGASGILGTMVETDGNRNAGRRIGTIGGLGGVGVEVDAMNRERCKTEEKGAEPLYKLPEARSPPRNARVNIIRPHARTPHAHNNTQTKRARPKISAIYYRFDIFFLGERRKIGLNCATWYPQKVAVPPPRPFTGP